MGTEESKEGSEQGMGLLQASCTPAAKESSQHRAPLAITLCRDGGLKVCLGIFALHDMVQLSGYTSNRESKGTDCIPHSSEGK